MSTPNEIRCILLHVADRDATEVILPADQAERIKRIQQLVGGYFTCFARISTPGSHGIYVLEDARDRSESNENAFMRNLQKLVFPNLPATRVYGSAVLVACNASGRDISLPARVTAQCENSWVDFITGDDGGGGDDGGDDASDCELDN